MPTSDRRALLPWFVLAYGVFFLNDIAFMRATGWQDWIVADYGSRLLVLALLLAPRGSRALLLRREPLRVGIGMAALLVVACVVLDRLLDLGLMPFTASLLGTHRLAGFPPLPPELRVIDLTLGVLLVAVSEELLCRRAALLALRDHVRSDAGMIVVSAVLFAAMHWTYSPPELINVFLIGCVFMAIYLRIGALWPLIVAHDVIDVIAFW